MSILCRVAWRVVRVAGLVGIGVHPPIKRAVRPRMTETPYQAKSPHYGGLIVGDVGDRF